MATPKDFEGKIEIHKIESFGFFPEDEEKETFTMWFYRREGFGTLKEFLNTIKPENMGYDQPSNQLFYRALSGKLYRVDFTPIN